MSMTVSDQEAAGPSGAGAAVFEGKAADRLAQPFPDFDTVDLLAVCDLDVDALVGWCVWRTLQADALIESSIRVALQLIGEWTCLPELTEEAVFGDLPQRLATDLARTHGLSTTPTNNTRGI
ncbi:hypothetical protein SEA_KIKO_42 [Gordonia phage Kiko]|nr:hypothetical protein SEA_KIKO_42 [Gordonia phage Kiko]